MRLIVLLALLAGCSDLSGREVAAFLDNNVSILADVETRLDTIETFAGSDPQAHGKGDGVYAEDGTLDAMGAWTDGTVDVHGSGTSAQNGQLINYDLALTYNGIVREGTTYDGDVNALIQVALADGAVSVLYQIDGDVVCTGTIDGEAADMDWTYAASSADGGRPHYGGTIDGHDVAP